MTRLEAKRIEHKIQRTLLWIDQVVELAFLEGANEMLSAREAALIESFNQATNRVAEKIRQLAAAAGLSPEADAAFTALADHLNSMGADPNNPLPPPVEPV